MPSLLVRNLAQLASPAGSCPVRGKAMRTLRILHRPVLVMRDGRFVFVGNEGDLPPELASDIVDDFDARGSTALPGFVDSHTHLPFAGFRESEFNRRLSGETYAEIAASGGGIASTVRETRKASEEQLVALVLERTARMAAYGTTTAEAKSGYGLTLFDEVKQLRAIAAAGDSGSAVRLVPTCLAAHDFPPGCSSDAEREDWITTIIDEILPEVSRQKLARFNDVFIERGVFSPEQGERILLRGKELGLTPRVHADELSDTGGAALAVRAGAASADHLMQISESGVRALAASDTVANLLPGTSFFLMTGRYAPARDLIDGGAIVSLSTDCNPGSSMTESMPVAMQLAVLQMRMTVEEAVTAATLNGAYSLGLASEIGSIEEGKRADFVLIDAPNYHHLVYHFGVNLAGAVFRDGKLVARDGRAVSSQPSGRASAIQQA